MIRHNFYHVLGITSHASPADVRAAYVRLVKMHHPDVAGNLPERLREIQEAYKCLMDVPSRAAHDQMLSGREQEHHSQQYRRVRRLRRYDQRHPVLPPSVWQRRRRLLAASLLAALPIIALVVGVLYLEAFDLG